MAKEQITMPTGFGGLMRYKEEYGSKIVLKPYHVIIFIVMIVLFVILLNVFFPLS